MPLLMFGEKVAEWNMPKWTLQSSHLHREILNQLSVDVFAREPRKVLHICHCIQ